jgi:hypothetical protein
MFDDFIVKKLYSIDCIVTTHIHLQNLFFSDSQYHSNSVLQEMGT